MLHPSIHRASALLPVRFAVGLGFLMHGIAKFQRGPEKFIAGTFVAALIALGGPTVASVDEWRARRR